MPAAKKTTAGKKPAAKAKSTTAKAPSRPRKTAKTIRNLRGCPVHLRLQKEDAEKPFRVQLAPRGLRGDTAIIPVGLVDNPGFVQDIGVLYEIITTTEAANIEYASVGYLGRTDAPQILREEDTVIQSAKNWDGKGKSPQEREIRRDTRGHVISERDPSVGTGMHTIDVPGSDTGLHKALAENNAALPPQASFDRSRVTIERVKGE